MSSVYLSLGQEQQGILASQKQFQKFLSKDLGIDAGKTKITDVYYRYTKGNTAGGTQEHGSRRERKEERSGTGEVGGLDQYKPFEMAEYVKNQEK